jgi:hypothetical protein
MKSRVNHRSIAGSALATALVIVTIASIAAHSKPPKAQAASADGEFSTYVSKDGDISLPKGYRERFLHLGAWAVAKKPNEPVYELHNVYAQPQDIQAFRKDGKFPDGAVLVKEITNVAAAKLTTGESSWSTDIEVWFVMIKDSKGRFPGNDLWGDGWGWALFKADEPARNVATDYATDCKTCHIPAKQDDWIYVRGYPVLGKQGPAH